MNNQPDHLFELELLFSLELEIVEALSTGMKREEISAKLGISVLTYDGYMKNIRLKLKIRSQASWGELMYSIKHYKT